ncbi:MAG: matrixin family metalloprotease, partial [Myxococcota bacterium]
PVESQDIMSYQVFKQSLIQASETEYFLEEDIVLQEEHLPAFYRAHIAPEHVDSSPEDTNTPAGKRQQALIQATRSDGRAYRWPEHRKKNITYCVSDDFGVHHAAMLSIIQDAFAAWSSASQLEFGYRPQHNANCTRAKKVVSIVVRPTEKDSKRFAYAYFPYFSGKAFRSAIVFNPSKFFHKNRSVDRRLNTAMHEVGHTLGFAHEFSNSEEAKQRASVCTKNATKYFRPITDYDVHSILNYQSCGGTRYQRKASLSAQDKIGVARVYGRRFTSTSTTQR